MHKNVIWLPLLMLSFAHQQSIEQTPSLSQRIASSVYYGQDAALTQVLDSISKEEARKMLNAQGSNHEHSIHLLLKGWHGFVENSFGLKSSFSAGCARYARALDALIAHGANASQECPLVDALHYRNRMAMTVLMRSMNHSQIVECLSVKDALGQTALHLGCKATSAGSARIFAKIRTSLLAPGSSDEKKRRLAELEDILSFLSISHLPEWINATISRSSLLDALLPWTLDVVLEQGLALRLGLDWFDAKDFRGYSARDYAVRSGERWVRPLDDARKQAVSYSLPLSASASSCSSSSPSSSLLPSSSCNLLAPPLSSTSLFTCDSTLCYISSATNSTNSWRQSIPLTLYKALHLHIFDHASSFAHETSNTTGATTTTDSFATSPALSSSPSMSLSPQQLLSSQSSKTEDIDSCSSLRIPIDRLIYSSVCHSEIWSQFHSDYVKRKRPVVLCGVDLSLPAPLKWDRASVLERYGEHNMSVGSIPYADTYGLPAEKMSLWKFIDLYMSRTPNKENNTRRKKQSVGGCKAASHWDLPLYVFDTSLSQMFPSHFQFAFLSLLQPPPLADSQCMLEPLSPNFVPVGNDSRPISLQQFSLGPALSGSAAHWHQTALNVLLQGLKLWFLFPPSSSFWSLVPPFHFLICDYLKTCTGNGSDSHDRFGAHAVILQRPGEVVYVPDEWGHVVLNLADSIAYAAEFFE